MQVMERKILFGPKNNEVAGQAYGLYNVISNDDCQVRAVLGETTNASNTFIETPS
jgi:hypothetical protein